MAMIFLCANCVVRYFITSKLLGGSTVWSGFTSLLKEVRFFAPSLFLKAECESKCAPSLMNRNEQMQTLILMVGFYFS